MTPAFHLTIDAAAQDVGAMGHRDDSETATKNRQRRGVGSGGEGRGSRWALLRAALLCVTAAAVGCGGSDATALSIQLGTLDPAVPGEFVFLPLVDDMQVQLASGAQGGFHIWTLYRVTGNSVDRKVKVRRYIDRLGPGGMRQRVLTGEGSEHLPAESPWELLTPIPSFVCPTPIGVNALDAPLELKVRFESDTPMAELLGEQTVRVRAGCPPSVNGDNQYAFCMMICVG